MALHQNNKHKNGYDLDALILEDPGLEQWVFTNTFGTKTIDFSNPKAVRLLNKSLLKAHYNIDFWEFSEEHLTPPIPGRVEYIHRLKDLLLSTNTKVTSPVLDIGTGASLIYPLLGTSTYKWTFVGTDISRDSLKSAQLLIEKNNLSESILLRHQTDPQKIVEGVIKKGDQFTATICNPPFFKSEKDAQTANSRKNKNLGLTLDTRNFGGNASELWYKGGEKAFLHNYIYQSAQFKNQCIWFTSLVSNKENLKSLKTSLKKLQAKSIEIIPMIQGNKTSRILAWTFI
ncbi:23S rRNA (adenine(1618)-N(6))-methyltransferase RlmF [Urechidicola sp. KH5]